MGAALLAGCARSEYRAESQAPSFPPYEGKVELLESFPPAGTYDRLGVVTVEVYALSYSDTLTKKITGEAAARGANAVVLQGKVRTRRDAQGHETEILAGWAIRVRE